MAKQSAKKSKGLVGNRNKYTGVGKRGYGTGAGALRNIETPEKLWDLFQEFVKWSRENPYLKHVYTNAKGKKIYEERPRALVFIGFEGWLAMRSIVCDLSRYERSESFVPTIKQIRRACSQDTIGGALNGIYNANLTARLEKLSEHVETSGEINTPAPQINIYNVGPPLEAAEDKVQATKEMVNSDKKKK